MVTSWARRRTMRTPITVPGSTATTYTGFGTGVPAALSWATDVNPVSLGQGFKVTQAGLSLSKIRLFWPAGHTAANTLPCGLFAAGATGATGSTLPGTSGTITAVPGSWAEFTLPTPYALTSGTNYYAEVYASNGGYGADAFTFTADVVVGPITFPQDGIGGVTNGGFRYGASILPVNSSFHAAWYGVDIEVTT